MRNLGDFLSLRAQPGIGTPGMNVHMTPLRFGVGPSMPSMFYKPYPGQSAARYDAMRDREHDSYLMRTQLAAQAEMQRRANQAALYQQGQYLNFQGRQNALDRVQPRGAEGAQMMMQQQRLEHEAAQAAAERDARMQLQNQLFGHQSQLTDKEWRHKSALQSGLLGSQSRQADMDRAAQLMMGRQTLEQQAQIAQAERELREKLGLGELDVERMKANLGPLGDGTKKPLDPVMMRMYESMLNSEDPAIRQQGINGLSAAIEEREAGPVLNTDPRTQQPSAGSPMLEYARQLAQTQTGGLSPEMLAASAAESANLPLDDPYTLYQTLGPQLDNLGVSTQSLSPAQAQETLQRLGVTAEHLRSVAEYAPVMSADRFDPLLQKTFGAIPYLMGFGENKQQHEVRQRRQQIAGQLLDIMKGQPTAGDNIQQDPSLLQKSGAGSTGDNRLPAGATNEKLSPGVNDRSAIGPGRSLEEQLDPGVGRFAGGGDELKRQLAAQLLAGTDRLAGFGGGASSGGVSGGWNDPLLGDQRMPMASRPKTASDQLAESIFGGREPETWSRGPERDMGRNRANEGLAGPRKMPGLGTEDRQAAPLEAIVRQSQPGPMSRPSDRPVQAPQPTEADEPGILDRIRPRLEGLVGNTDFDVYEQLSPTIQGLANLPAEAQLAELGRRGLSFDTLRRFAEYVPTLAADAVNASTYLPWMLFGESQEDAMARRALQGTARALMQLMQRGQ